MLVSSKKTILYSLNNFHISFYIYSKYGHWLRFRRKISDFNMSKQKFSSGKKFWDIRNKYQKRYKKKQLMNK